MTRRKPAAPPEAGQTGGDFRSRIVGEGFEDPRRLKANPLNWRVHTKIQRGAVRDALVNLGWLQRVIVNKRTGNIIDGHLRVETAVENNEPRVPVEYVDLSADEERLALATLDPLAELAATDPDKLAALLGRVENRGDGALANVLADLEATVAGAVLRDVKTGGQRSAVPSAAVLRFAVSIPDVNVVERAIAATGAANRGEAVTKICTAYLNSLGEPDETRDTTRQLDARAEGDVETRIAQALRSAGHS